MPTAPCIVYLCESFPVANESFLPREIQSLEEAGMRIYIQSLDHPWVDSWNKQPVHFVGIEDWLLLLYWLFYWLIQKPQAIGRILSSLFFGSSTPAGWKNFTQTLYGAGCGLLLAKKFTRGVRLIYATDGGASATAGWVINRLAGTPFSFTALAHDVMNRSGDWLLNQKLRNSFFIRTFSEFTHKAIVEKPLGVQEKTEIIGQGIISIPAQPPVRFARPMVRCLSVGPLLQRKGYRFLLQIYSALKESGELFEAHIIGKGPQLGFLKREIVRLGLQHHVRIFPAVSAAQLLEQYLWADVFLYTGTITDHGDTDDLPSAILEAMATSLPVITTPHPSVLEVILAGYTGLVCAYADTENWTATLKRLRSDRELEQQIAQRSKEWIAQHCLARESAKRLSAAWDNYLEAWQS